VLNLFRARVCFIEAVTLSGGEPLAQAGLLDAILDIKKLGFLIGLHTAGSMPVALARVVPHVNWVGLDVKHDFKNYELITCVDGSGMPAYESLKIAIAAKNMDLEVRITLHESIETSSILNVLKEISSMGVKDIVLQKCRNNDDVIVEHSIFSDKLLLEDISKYFDNFTIR
jgi:pyruvate formate lyase activating enzyme